MNKGIALLAQIAQKPSRMILGLMSGTSLDGLDLALCHIAGSGVLTTLEVKHFRTIPYENDLKNEIKQVLSQTTVSLEQLTLLNAWLGRVYAAWVLESLALWQVDPAEVDCIASHGQTVYHAPAHQHQRPGFPHATLQLTDGDHIAQLTGIITLSDFRQKHVAAGGEGAPLVVYGDTLLFQAEAQDRVLLNIGGIANFTYLPARNSPNQVTATDCGPGNCLMDEAVQRFFPALRYDEGGLIAQQGSVNELLLQEMLNHPFLALPIPKTTGREVFHWDWVFKVIRRLQLDDITPEELIATLTAFTATTIAQALRAFEPSVMYVSGGGAMNPALMAYLRQQLPQWQVESSQGLGINPEAKEAALFALLANETLAGEGIAVGNLPPLHLGKISLPG